MTRNRLVNIVLVVALTTGGLFLYNKYRVAPPVQFAGLSLTDLQGQPVALNQYAQKRLFVNFFATWCGPCVAELPSLQQAQKMLKGQTGFVIISDEPLERLRSFQQRNGYSLTFLHSNTPLSSIDIHTIPTSYLLNSRQEILMKHVGEEEWSSEEWLKKLTE
ncbi:MAG: TlpA family protein disulfide reductase [Bacteroidetes bacterium]|nr:TlpA family protein disulfide reductase [Bacteroidota bacterium]